MTEEEHNVLSGIKEGLDDVRAQVAMISTELALLKGRFQGGWGVLLVLGAVVTVLGGWALALYKGH